MTTGNFKTLKVGDRVDFRKSRYWRGTGVVTKVYGDGSIDVKGDNGEGEMEIHEEDIMNSCVRSRNAVVANALNACGTARNADYTDATNKLRLCLDSLYKADDYRNEAVRTVAQLINEGIIDKSAASKMNELQKLFGEAMAVAKDLYYNKLRP